MDSLHKTKRSIPLKLHKLLLTIPTLISQHINPFRLHLSYILVVSILGFLLLQSLPMKHPSSPKPSHFDLFFTSVSANTVSSMIAVEMESFSNSQLILMTILMLLGSEIFTTMLPLLLLNHQPKPSSTQFQLVELETGDVVTTKETSLNSGSGSEKKYLGYVVSAYLVTLLASGWAFFLGYWSLFPATRAMLERRDIRPNTFAVFTVVSSLANCGYIPTNENMIVFRSCTGILLSICGLILLGNTLYPVGIRCTVLVLKDLTKRKEFELILKDREEKEDLLDMHVMRSGAEAAMLAATVVGLVVVQMVVFGVMEWGSEGLKGMSVYEKVVGVVFMAVNSRHSGETIVDLSILSSAVLLLFVVMM